MIECPDFLPLGSVIRLKGSQKTFLIIGRALVVQREDGAKEYYDYAFCPYPEGMVSDFAIYANHETIAEVCFEGYRNGEDEIALDQIREVLAKTDVPRGNPRPIDEW